MFEKAFQMLATVPYYESDDDQEALKRYTSNAEVQNAEAATAERKMYREEALGRNFREKAWEVVDPAWLSPKVSDIGLSEWNPSPLT